MAFTHGRKARVYFQGINLSAFLNNVDLDDTVDSAETSVFTGDSKTHIPGLRDAKAALGGVFDGGAEAQDEEITEALTGTGGDIFTYLPQGDLFGSRAVCWKANEVSYKMSTPIGDAAKWTAEAQVTGGTERGRVLHALAAEVGALNGSTDDNLASSAFGGAGYLQVIGAGPVTAFTVTIEDSANNIAFATIATFTAATDFTAERIAIVGTIRRYTRYTVSGDTGGLKFSVVLTRATS